MSYVIFLPFLIFFIGLGLYWIITARQWSKESEGSHAAAPSVLSGVVLVILSVVGLFNIVASIFSGE